MTTETPFGPEKDLFFMDQAIKLAHKGLCADEVPVGAIVVDRQGTIIGRGYNQVMYQCSQSAHAEMKAMTQAGKKQGDWRLEGCWLYITLEPCALCANMATLSRVEGIVFGAASPLFGYRNHIRLDNAGAVPLYRIDTIKMISGLREEESVCMLKQFFQQKRNASRG